MYPVGDFLHELKEIRKCCDYIYQIERMGIGKSKYDIAFEELRHELEVTKLANGLLVGELEVAKIEMNKLVAVKLEFDSDLECTKLTLKELRDELEITKLAKIKVELTVNEQLLDISKSSSTRAMYEADITALKSTIDVMHVEILKYKKALKSELQKLTQLGVVDSSEEEEDDDRLEISAHRH